MADLPQSPWCAGLGFHKTKAEWEVQVWHQNSSLAIALDKGEV